MDKSVNSLDWSLLQSFLAVAETGSLSAAARRLDASQPTIGRHIQALEQQLETSLFLRQAKGMALSETGLQLVEPARRMAEAAGQMALSALRWLQSVGVFCGIMLKLFLHARVYKWLSGLEKRQRLPLVSSKAGERTSP